MDMDRDTGKEGYRNIQGERDREIPRKAERDRSARQKSETEATQTMALLWHVMSCYGIQLTELVRVGEQWENRRADEWE